MVASRIKLVFTALVSLSLSLIQAQTPPDALTHEEVKLNLKRGPFIVFHFPAKLDGTLKAPHAIILFGSGSGGWSDWEERVCHKLQMDGYELIGVNLSIYGQNDYDLDILETDYQTMEQYCLKSYGQNPPPLVVGGWSTGAEQAVAVGGGPHPPSGLTGLLLISPGSSGGYGWYATRYFSFETAPTRIFNLQDFAPKLTHLRIAQWHAGLDPLDSRAWLSSLPAPHREFDFSGAIHTYNGASDEFLVQLSKSVAWILDKKSDASASSKISVN